MTEKKKHAERSVLLYFIITLLVTLPVRAADILIPGGEAVGIVLESDGVIVSELAHITTVQGELCPAKDAGLLPGDRIIAVNGCAVSSGEDFLREIADMDGSEVRLTLCRGNETKTAALSPVRDGQGHWKLGLWLRSGISGLGTVTFWDPATGRYGALGHGVSLPEEQGRLVISGGEITEAEVSSVVPGAPGKPGELCGAPAADKVLGTVEKNTDAGIFGRCDVPEIARRALPVASEAEIRTGEATILSTVGAEGVREYSAEIIRITRGGNDPRQMTVSITDPALLSATGGIVQGMSGSPILQNGKLVGAVTHVLLSDPTKGYGISIENMLRSAA